MQKHTFNLIEILMAMGVLMIGVVSIMGLFPLASKVTSDAALEMTAPSVMEDMSAMVRDLATRPGNWGSWVSGANPIIPVQSSVPNGNLGFSTEDDLMAFLDNPTQWKQEKNGVKWSDSFPQLYACQSKPGVFMLLSIRGKDWNSFKLSNKDDRELIESRTLLFLWQSQIERVFDGSNSTKKTKYGDKFGVRLNMKVAWPAERLEANTETVDGKTVLVPQRKIKVMSFDLLNPDPASVSTSTPPATNP